MSEPQGTHRVASDDSETTEVYPYVATAVAESDPELGLRHKSEECYEESLAATNKYKGATEEKIIVKQAQEKVSQGTRGEMDEFSESTYKILLELSAKLSRHDEQLAHLTNEIKAMRTELRELRLTDVEQRAKVTLDMPAGSTQESSETQREDSRILTEPFIESGADEETLTEVSSFPQPQVEEIPRSGETTGYSEEPSSIDIAIGEILDRVEAGHHILVEDPDDSTQICIIGVFVERALTDFEALTSQPDFQELNIVPHNVDAIRNGLPQYAKHLMRFGLEKDVQVNAQGRAERTTNHPKCQLIVTATQVNNSSTAAGSDFEPGYYGVTVAHAFLTHSQTERLVDSEQYDESIRTEVLEETWNTHWSLREQTANNQGLLKIVQPPLWDYQEYFLDRRKFLQDIAVFRIPETKLGGQRWREIDRDTGEEQVLIFNSGIRKYKVGGLLPIRCHKDITYLCGKRVLIDSLEGTFNLPPRQVPRRGVSSDMQLGLHVTFRIKPPHSLEEGHSGLMAYVVDKDNTTVYIAGMLTGYLDKFEEISGKRVYQAVVVGEGLRRIEEKFPLKIQNIQMLKNKLANHTMKNLVNQLQDGPRMN